MLAAPLLEMARCPRLLWGVHLAYFGLYVVGAILIQASPEFHTVLLSAVKGELSRSGKGPLVVRRPGLRQSQHALRGPGYLSGQLSAQLVRDDQPAVDDRPRLRRPAGGIRATIWGVLLGPSLVALTKAMLPHTGTLLLEGEGYILATFFALLIPVYLFGSSEAPDKPSDQVSEFDEIPESPEAPPPRRNTVIEPVRQGRGPQPQGQCAGGYRAGRGGLLRGVRGDHDDENAMRLRRVSWGSPC